MQLIARFRIASQEKWRSAFDADAEARRNAGLTLLQIWREEDAGEVWLLFEVADRARAQEYLRGIGGMHAGDGGAAEVGHNFLNTV